MAIIPARTNPECDGPMAGRTGVSIEFEREPRRWWWPFGRGRLRARFLTRTATDCGCELLEETSFIRPGDWYGFATTAAAIQGNEERSAMAAKIADQWWWPIVTQADIAQARLKRGKRAEELLEVAECRLTQTTNEMVRLSDRLRDADRQIRALHDCGRVARSIRSADGVTIERGDNAFLGTDPERRLILIDEREAIEATSLRMIGLPDGVPVFSRRDLARAWKRSSEAPSAQPASDAAEVPAIRDANASPCGTGDGTVAGTIATDVPLFGGVGR